MKKSLNLYLSSLLIVMVFMITPQTIKAVDVCASNLIYCNNTAQCRVAAEVLCVPACQNADATWNGQWNNDDPACHWFWWGQYAVCGCTPLPLCKCEGDSQPQHCTEAQKCSSYCDCKNGRSCKNGTCVEGYYCGDSNQYSCPPGLVCGPRGWCETPCHDQCDENEKYCTLELCANAVPVLQAICFAGCITAAKICNSGCGASSPPSPSKDKKPTPPSTHITPPKEKEAPSETSKEKKRPSETSLVPPKEKEGPSETPTVPSIEKEGSTETPAVPPLMEEKSSESSPVFPKEKEEAVEPHPVSREEKEKAAEHPEEKEGPGEGPLEPPKEEETLNP